MFQLPIPTLTTLQKSSLAYIKIFQNTKWRLLYNFDIEFYENQLLKQNLTGVRTVDQFDQKSNDNSIS